MRPTPIFFANLGLFLSTYGWGWWSDRVGRRAASPAALIQSAMSTGRKPWASFANVRIGDYDLPLRSVVEYAAV